MDELSVLRALHRPGTIVDVGAQDGALTLPLAALPGARVASASPASFEASDRYVFIFAFVPAGMMEEARKKVFFF